MTLEVCGLRAGYGRRDVLHGIDLRARAGEVVALLGPNGCGKTTFIRAVAGAIAPVAGTVAIAGHDASRLTARARARLVATVAQGAGLPARFSALDCVLMGRTPHIGLFGSESARDLAAVREAMERTHCWDLRDRMPAALSGGERQRVTIARALAQQPALLLLDEPTSHLDLLHQVETFALVVDLCRRERLAAVAVVHDVTLAAAYADRVAVMHEGRIVADGAPADVLTGVLLERVYGVPVRVIAHPATGRPIAVPETSRMAPADVDWLERIADPGASSGALAGSREP